jgi:hypothetical protein
MQHPLGISCVKSGGCLVLTPEWPCAHKEHPATTMLRMHTFFFGKIGTCTSSTPKKNSGTMIFANIEINNGIAIIGK